MGRRRKGRKVSAEEVEKMVQLYAELGTYKAVAKRMGRNPDTVAKYVGRREAIQQVGLYYESVIEDMVK